MDNDTDDYPFLDPSNLAQLISTDGIINPTVVRHLCHMLAEGCVNREIAVYSGIPEQQIQLVRTKVIGAEISDMFDYPIIVNSDHVIDRSYEIVYDSIDGDITPDELVKLTGISPRLASKILSELHTDTINNFSPQY